MIKFQKLGPVLKPDEAYQAKFNAGMVEANGEIHMLYRFCEKRSKWYNRSIDWYHLDGEFPYIKDYICYAKINPDGTLQSDSNHPVIFPDRPYDSIACEDPRIVLFEGSCYIFYCGLGQDPAGPLGAKARVGVAKTDDFIHYQKLGFVNNFAWDKDAFIFPERINGKIAYVHRIAPDIQIDYFDNFDELLSDKSWEGYEGRVGNSVAMRGLSAYESKKIGGGIPPIKTEIGWLMLYHGVDGDSQYHVMAALLDLNDPFKIIGRLPYPVLSPEEDFETSGDYMGCVFPQGYFLKDGELFISYGTADKYTAMAKTDFKSLLSELGKYPALK
jgi:predicted GH43/DUF377 family glycosyl hydrolase